MTSNSDNEYLNKFRNTYLGELKQSHINHIALRLKENNLINNHDWVEKTQESYINPFALWLEENDDLINDHDWVEKTKKKQKYDSFFWKILCLLNDQKTAKSTFDIIVCSLHDFNLPEANNLEFAESTCNNNMKSLDPKQNIVAKIESRRTKELFSHPNNSDKEQIDKIKAELFFLKATESIFYDRITK
ncbi:Hypothetical predicted protein [Octopus vulgaris]|nr:Hypothetical predicted protein [Octopus vulgaris]